MVRRVEQKSDVGHAEKSMENNPSSEVCKIMNLGLYR